MKSVRARGGHFDTGVFLELFHLKKTTTISDFSIAIHYVVHEIVVSYPADRTKFIGDIKDTLQAR